MHVTGKLLAWLIVPLSIGTLVMAAKVVDQQGKWMKQVQSLRADNEKNAERLAAVRLERDSARAEVERATVRWTQYWDKVKGSLNPNNDLVADVGASAGIAQKQTLYAFALDEKGAPAAYVGPYTVTTAQPNISTLKPAFRIREADVARIKNTQLWRFRREIPASFSSKIADREAELASADELFARQTTNLDTQTKLVETSKEQLAERIAELLGGEMGKAAGAGLVEQVSKAEDERNAALVTIDGLRREINAQTATANRLISENQELARTLPKAAEPTPQAALPAAK